MCLIESSPAQRHCPRPTKALASRQLSAGRSRYYQLASTPRRAPRSHWCLCRTSPCPVRRRAESRRARGGGGGRGEAVE
ncbi:hypothetical protein JYU34_013396 [Plutella xylostella]|uniref:Uncharacterized protein n=1 Tax=Plutella xylostella TaxID=51655 RepID=A0ABQ7Q9M9_PLUXY|nr:hypothetical protein JYU34_013396 [Plutella xylostella]